MKHDLGLVALYSFHENYVKRDARDLLYFLTFHKKTAHNSK